MSNFRINRIKQDPNANIIGPKNANMQYFSGDYLTRIDTLVRETIQNPLDNPISKNKPIKIIFKQRKIKISDIPKSEVFPETMDALLKTLYTYKESETGLIQGYIDYYTKALDSLGNGQINVLQISDYNTTGLKGSRHDMKSNLGRFLGGDGVFDDGSAGGGSGGLGKYAPFMVSDLGFCFYSSLNKEKEYIYYGWGKYFTHKIGKNEYTGEINIGGGNNDVMTRKSPLKEGFLSERRKKGTDVFALGFSMPNREEIIWEEEIIKAVIRNFFGAIFDKKLIIEVETFENKINYIDSKTILEHLNLFDKTSLKRKGDLIPEGLTVEAVKTYSNGKVFKSSIYDTPILGECVVKIQQDDNYSRNFTFMRGPRMHIYKEKISAGDVNFSGVFICKTEKGNKELRRLEDSHHKNWKFNIDTQGRKIKKEIMTFIEKCINKVATFENPDEFSISGASLLSFGNSGKDKANQVVDKLSNKATSIIFPKNVQTSGVSKNNFNGEITVDRKGQKKKTRAKKPAYKKPNNPPEPIKPRTKKPSKERIYRVEDFKAMIFKNDIKLNEYHLYIESPNKSNIRSIIFDIPMENGKLAELDFIESVTDDASNILDRNMLKGAAINEFENFELNDGSNKFIVKTRFNKKVQIIIK